MSTPRADEPVKPEPPDPSECCGSGCVRCIFDLYDDALERYRIAHAEWNRNQDGDRVESDDA